MCHYHLDNLFACHAEIVNKQNTYSIFLIFLFLLCVKAALLSLWSAVIMYIFILIQLQNIITCKKKQKRINQIFHSVHVAPF